MKPFQKTRQRIGGALRVLRGLAATVDYKAASTIGRRLKGWLPSSRGPNATLIGSLDMLRRRSRSLVRENTHASAAIERFVSNAIGTGIVPISTHPDEGKRKHIQDTFLRWTDECDADGLVDFYGMQSLICRAERQDGEVFTRKRPRRFEDGLTVPLQLQVIESDFVPLNENSATEFETTRAGIVFDPIGRRKFYRMYVDHPGEASFAGTSGELRNIPASQILHVYRVKRPGQLRGEPMLTPAIVMLYELDQYVDATLLRAKLANLLAFFIKKLNDVDDTPPETLNEVDQEDGTALASIEPGSVNYLEPNEDVEVKPPVDPGSNFTEFVRSLLRSMAAAMGGLTYEQMSGDLSTVNFSSIRAGYLEARRWCEAYQHQVVVFQWCRPIWKAWVEGAVLAGVFDAAEYAEHPEWYEATWQPHRWPWVDPESDLAEAQGKIRAGLSSRTAEAAKLGEDARQIDKEQAQDNARADSLQLKYDSDGRNEKSTSAAAPAKQNSKNDPANNGTPSSNQN